MKHYAAFCAAAVLALSVTGCNSAAPDTREADMKALKDIETQWNQDFKSKDLAKVLAHYADDGVLMTPGGPASYGKDAMGKSIKEMLADPALSIKFAASKVEVAKSGDVAFTQGSYTMTMTDPVSKKTIDDRGSYVTTYRKLADGSWKAVSDIATSEVPPMAPPPPPAAKKAAKSKKSKK